MKILEKTTVKKLDRSAGKVVAQLKKHVHERVKAKAQQVREAWSGLLPAAHPGGGRARPGPRRL